jgi:uncharacterized protein UPF0158
VARRLPVDRGDLAMALTANPDAQRWYVDTRSGEVLMVPVDRFGDDDWPPEDEIEAGLDAGHLIAVEPLGSSVEYGWMVEFGSSVGDARLQELLDVALSGPGAFRRFKAVLRDHPEARARWFAVRDARLREVVAKWLEERDIEPMEAP